MFYKNAKFFQLTSELVLDDLEEQLSEYSLRPIGSQEMKVIGWAHIIGQEFSHSGNGHYTLKLGTESKLLPAKVINRELDKKCAEIEGATGTPVSKKARSDLKSEIIHRMLPNAFTKFDYIYGTITCDGLIIIDANSDTQSELFLSMLRKALGSLPVLPLITRSLITDLTEMVTDTSPKSFQVLESCTIEHGEHGKIDFKKVSEMSSDENLHGYIGEGYMVTKLALGWNEVFTMFMSHDSSLKKIKFSDVIKEQNDDIPKDQQDAKFDADLCLNNGELNVFGNLLVSMYGEE